MPHPSRLLAGLAACAAAAVAFASEFPRPHNSGGNPARPALTPEESLAVLQLPKGFRASVFAAEPDVQNPVALAWDARGRLWIAENYTYAERTLKFDLTLRDRVLIFEDAKGDGRFSSRRVFGDEYQRLSSVAIGHGGVWLMCSPQLLFVPDADEDGVPDGPAQVVLDGFTIPPENFHGFANGLKFGPDGWLYGRCGASAPGELGAPGTPREERVPLRGTIWRYHPQRRVVEVLGSGTTNPWGHDWDEHGELFFINTVNGHLWHGIPGAHYARSHTIDPNPHAYALLDMHADHWHFDTAQDWTRSRDGAANALGGGHAHAGVMIYQGDNWPAEYRGKLYTLNFHGRRANQETLARHGSGYVARHGADVFVSGDPWFRGIDLASGPDGGVFVLDWSDTGECHNALGVSRTSGRIYKIVHGAPPAPAPIDLTRSTPEELVALHTHANDWFVRQARVQLATRVAAGRDVGNASQTLEELARREESPLNVRALCTLHAIGAARPALLRELLEHRSEHVRTWAIRFLTDAWPLDTVLSARPVKNEPAPDPAILAALVRSARNDSSGLVRLALASTLQRLPPAHRTELALALVARREDATDRNLPLTIWYGLIPLGNAEPLALARVAAASELPAPRRFAARRLAEELERDPAPLAALLAAASGKPAAFQSDVAAGIAEGLRGWRRAPKPAGWEAFAAQAAAGGDPVLQERIRELALVFGDGRALDEVKALALDGRAELGARKAALRALIEARPADLRQVCQQLLRVRFLNTVALGGLALFDDPALGEAIAAAYASFHPSERGAVLETLAARPAFARVLLAFVANGRIPLGDITPFHARQIRSFGDPALSAQLASAWGEWREPAADKRMLIAQLKTRLNPEVLAHADKSRGRAAFQALCASCHRLYGNGGDLGPDLTGAGRNNLDYVLENIVDPGAVVTADFRMSVVKLKDGRTLNGFIAARTTCTLTIRSVTESQTIERTEIVSIEELPQSVMPEGLLETLSSDEQRDLVAYLMHPTQVPLP